ncbi:MAG TPA: helix-turn-helix domain-containing protein [bacterium]|nr:helix-turn-helix domain-containing protein [bacterium]
MYTISRLEGAELLSVSTRTIDRYVRLGKIRMKKIGKNIQLHQDDVERLRRGGIQEEVTIVPKPRSDDGFRTRPIESGGLDYKTLYEEAKDELERKDASVRELAYALGKIEADLKNSISLAEHKKTAFLLESSRSRSEEAANQARKELSALETTLATNRTINTSLVVVTVITALAAGLVWFVSI